MCKYLYCMYMWIDLLSKMCSSQSDPLILLLIKELVHGRVKGRVHRLQEQRVHISIDKTVHIHVHVHIHIT